MGVKANKQMVFMGRIQSGVTPFYQRVARGFVCLLFLFAAVPAKMLPQNGTHYEVKTVIIDPGHGGKDPGALGTGRYKATESDVALDVSLRVRDYIKKYYPHVNVIMTRDTDVFLELYERTKIANDAKANLFISVHCNSNRNTGAYGAETFVLGMHKTQANLEVAKRENQVIYLEDNYEENYAGFDPNSPESMIALSMMQSEYLNQSILFADLVQSQFRDRVHRRDRGVKQAGFWVISRTIMPSVLIELGFISNDTEEDFLNSEQGKVYMASAVYRAFKEYKTAMEGVDTAIDPDKEAEGSDNQEAGTDKANAADSLVFKVQVASSTTQVPLEPENFKGLENVEELPLDGVFKYTVGNESDFESAVKIQRKVRKQAYKDAFIIALYQGKRISLQEAFEILKKQS